MNLEGGTEKERDQHGLPMKCMWSWPLDAGSIFRPLVHSCCIAIFFNSTELSACDEYGCNMHNITCGSLFALALLVKDFEYRIPLLQTSKIGQTSGAF
jgi:hypothetical protein